MLNAFFTLFSVISTGGAFNPFKGGVLVQCAVYVRRLPLVYVLFTQNTHRTARATHSLVVHKDVYIATTARADRIEHDRNMQTRQLRHTKRYSRHTRYAHAHTFFFAIRVGTPSLSSSSTSNRLMKCPTVISRVLLLPLH